MTNALTRKQGAALLRTIADAIDGDGLLIGAGDGVLRIEPECLVDYDYRQAGSHHCMQIYIDWPEASAEVQHLRGRKLRRLANGKDNAGKRKAYSRKAAQSRPPVRSAG